MRRRPYFSIGCWNYWIRRRGKEANAKTALPVCAWSRRTLLSSVDATLEGPAFENRGCHNVRLRLHAGGTEAAGPAAPVDRSTPAGADRRAARQTRGSNREEHGWPHRLPCRARRKGGGRRLFGLPALRWRRPLETSRQSSASVNNAHPLCARDARCPVPAGPSRAGPDRNDRAQFSSCRGRRRPLLAGFEAATGRRWGNTRPGRRANSRSDREVRLDGPGDATVLIGLTGAVP